MRIAILGAGFMGQVHAAGWQAVPDARIVTIYAPSATRAVPLAEASGAHWSSDLDGVLTDPAVDVVDICLPTPEHAPTTLAAHAAGKHVLLEKPIALTAPDAAKVTAIATTGPAVMVAHVLRFWPEYVESQRLVAAGAIGRVRSAVATRRQPPPAWSSLFARADLTGGAVVDMLVHDFDALNWILGRPVAVTARGRVNARSGGYDQVQVLIDYADGASAVVDGGMELPESYPFGSRLEVLGEQGALAYHFHAGGRSFEEGAGINQLSYYPASGPAQVVEVTQADPFQQEIAYFAECVRSGQRPVRVTANDARLALLVALAARDSIAGGGVRIELPG